MPRMEMSRLRWAGIGTMALALAACGDQRADDTDFSLADNGWMAALSNEGAALPPLPDAEPMMVADQSAPQAPYRAPLVEQLPATEPIAYAQPQGASDYAWIDRADMFAETLGEAPPDYGFAYEDGVTPWAWQSSDDYLRYAEPIDGGYRYYYYEPGAASPWLVSDPWYSYGYRDERLVAVYDRGGRALPWREARARDAYAARYYARARDMRRVARARDRERIEARQWAAQRAAIRPSREGRRKVILASSIAETSLTIDGVRIVVDSGLARRPRYDRAAGVTRLVTERASQASATQRAGRAARQRPGVAYRLWEAAATAGMPPFDPPEILESDLSSLLLDCALWGASDPASLRWLDPPPAPAVTEARKRLTLLDALDEDGRITAHGKALAKLPLSPRLAHMLVRAGERGLGDVAADVAVLLGERGIGGQDTDLTLRRQRWRRESGKRAEAARAMARRWARLISTSETGSQQALPGSADHHVGLCLALAFPDRIAKRRSADGADWASVGGRGFRLDPLSPLAREEWLAVGEVQGSAAGARILSAAPLSEADVLALFGHRVTEHRSVRFRAANGGVEALRERRLGAVRLSSGSDDRSDPAAVVAALTDGVRQGGLSLLPWSDAARSLRMRAAFAGIDALSDPMLIATLDDWLPPLLQGKRRLSDIDRSQLSGMLEGLIGWGAKQQLDRLAPPDFRSPAGSAHAIDYAAEGGPRVELRVQALFGLATHPTVGSARIPLVLSLTSPAGRPIQTTRDLPGFWAGNWRDVAKKMRGRYPRHPWPDDPAAASATLRTKKADARAKS